jgi:hypothetical protein
MRSSRRAAWPARRNRRRAAGAAASRGLGPLRPEGRVEKNAQRVWIEADGTVTYGFDYPI